MAVWDEQIPGQDNQALDPLSTFLSMIGTMGAARSGKRSRSGLPGGMLQANMPVEPVPTGRDPGMSAPPMSPEVAARNAQSQQILDSVTSAQQPSAGLPEGWNLLAQGLPSTQAASSSQSGQPSGANIDQAKQVISSLPQPHGVDANGQIDWSKFKRSPLEKVATFLQPLVGAYASAQMGPRIGANHRFWGALAAGAAATGVNEVTRKHDIEQSIRQQQMENVKTQAQIDKENREGRRGLIKTDIGDGREVWLDPETKRVVTDLQGNAAMVAPEHGNVQVLPMVVGGKEVQGAVEREKGTGRTIIRPIPVVPYAPAVQAQPQGQEQTAGVVPKVTEVKKPEWSIIQGKNSEPLGVAHNIPGQQPQEMFDPIEIAKEPKAQQVFDSYNKAFQNSQDIAAQKQDKTNPIVKGLAGSFPEKGTPSEQRAWAKRAQQVEINQETAKATAKQKAELTAQQNMFGGGSGSPSRTSNLKPGQKDEALLSRIQAQNPGLANTVKALAEGRMDFPKGTALRSQYGQQLISLVSEYDPTFDAVNYSARSKTRGDFTSGKSAGQVNALNTVIGHLDSLSTAADGLSNTWSPTWNSVANALATSSGDPKVKKFEVTKNAVTDELTRVWRQAGGTEADVKSWEKQLNASGSPEQLHTTIAQIGDLLESKLSSLQDQYTAGMGTADRQMVTAKSRATLDKLERKQGGTPQARPSAAPAPGAPSPSAKPNDPLGIF